MAAHGVEADQTLESASPGEVAAEEEALQPEVSIAALSPYAVALWSIFALLLLFALYFARSVALPVALASLASLVLAPVVRALRRLRIPPPVSAAVLLLGLLGSLLYGVYALSGPAADWMQRAPASAREVERKLRFLRQPVEAVTQATQEVERAAQLGAPSDTRTVVVRPHSLSDVLLDQTQGFLSGLLVTGILLFFLLSSPDDFLEKLVNLAPRLRDKKRIVAAAREIEGEVSTYLLVISAINAGFGLAVGAALFALGVPNAALWGALAFVTNFVPYVGAFALGVVLAGVGVLSFEDPWHMAQPALAFVALNAIEANLVTPLALGKRLTLSPVVVFVWVILWSWLWGVPGGIIAVPLLAAGKIALSHIPQVAPLARLLD
jgi:predicted PurR-regulated permease PerM